MSDWRVILHALSQQFHRKHITLPGSDISDCTYCLRTLKIRILYSIQTPQNKQGDSKQCFEAKSTSYIWTNRKYCMWQETSIELQLWLGVIEHHWTEISDFILGVGMNIVAHWYEFDIIDINISIDWYLSPRYSKNRASVHTSWMMTQFGLVVRDNIYIYIIWCDNPWCCPTKYMALFSLLYST